VLIFEFMVKPFFNFKLRRPFVCAHWSLLAVATAVWEFLLIGQPCRESPLYLETSFATITVCVALWVNHLRFTGIGGFRSVGNILAGAAYDLALLALWIIVVALPISLLTPTYQCYTNRAKVSELVLAGSVLRNEIGQRAMQNKTMSNSGAGIVVPIEGRTKGGVVTVDGTIVVAGDDPPAVIIFTPSLIDGKIEWKCRGFPARVVPMSCRD
jgi:type IV pilus assembly protein PilA